MEITSSRSVETAASTRPLFDLLRNVNPRSPSKFNEIGLSRLQKSWQPKDIPSSIFQRELGFVYYPTKSDDGWWNNNVCRQLVSSRAPGSKTILSKVQSLTQDSNQSLSNAVNKNGQQWTRTKLPSSAKLDFVGETLMIEEPFGTRVVRRIITPNPYSDNSYHLEYKIVTEGSKKKWNAFELWYVGHLESRKANGYKGRSTVPKIPNTLFALEDRKLLLYNLNTGDKIEDFQLSFPLADSRGFVPKYSSLQIDNEVDSIYCQASSSSLLKTEIFFEVLVFSYPPLSLKFRVQIPKGVLGKGYTQSMNLESLFLCFKPTTVEISNFDELINMDKEQEDTTENVITITLKKPKSILASVKTKNSYLAVVPRIWPPHVFTRSKECFEISSLQNLGLPIITLPNQSSGADLFLHSYCDLPYLLYSVPQGYEIWKVHQTLPGSAHLSETSALKVFSSREELETLPSEVRQEAVGQLQRNARGLRKLPRKFYGGMDSNKFYGFDYNLTMDLFAVCSVTDDTYILDITLYDNITMKAFKKLQPVQLEISKKCKDTFVAKLSVHFQNTYLAVKLKQSSGVYATEIILYTVNLMSEVLK